MTGRQVQALVVALVVVALVAASVVYFRKRGGASVPAAEG